MHQFPARRTLRLARNMMVMLLTAPFLMALGSGVPRRPGAETCFYCGAACDETFARAAYVRSTFNDWRLVARPDSRFVCAGCTLCVDELRRMPGRDKPQRTRNYSWLLSSAAALPFDKSRLAELRQCCLHPPTPPFALCLAVSGQKHLLFRAPVNHDENPIAVQFEEQRVLYDPLALAERLKLCAQLIAAAGKPALAAAPDHQFAFRLAEHFGEACWPLLETWQAVQGEPLSQLAVFLSPNKEVARAVHPPAPAAA